MRGERGSASREHGDGRSRDCNERRRDENAREPSSPRTQDAGRDVCQPMIPKIWEPSGGKER